jgi:hypothetical protein
MCLKLSLVGIGVYHARINMNDLAIDQTGFYTPRKNIVEKPVKYLLTPPSPGLRYDAVVGSSIVKVIAAKPQPVQTQRQLFHQGSFALSVLVDKQEHQLENNSRVYRYVPIDPIEFLNAGTDKGEVNELAYTPKGMVGRHATLKGNPVVEQLWLSLL